MPTYIGNLISPPYPTPTPIRTAPPIQASMPALNASLSQDLACLFLPTFSPSSRSESPLLLPLTPTPWDARGLARACCPFAHAKFLDLRSSWSLPPHHPTGHAATPPSFRAAAAQGRRTGVTTPSGDRAWLALAQAVTATLPSADANGAPVSTLAAQVTLRGMDPCAPAVAGFSDPRAKAQRGQQQPPASRHGGADSALAALLGEQLPRSLRLAPWWRPAHHHQQQHQHQGGVATVYSVGVPARAETGPGLAVCANRSDAGAAIGRVLARAAAMAEHRAYLHWYERHGVGVDDFAAAFDGLRRVVEEYGELRGGGVDGACVVEAEQQRAWHGRAALKVVRDFAVN